MIRTLAIGLLLLTGCATTSPAPTPAPPVARVNGAVITQSAFDVRLHSALTSIRQGGGPAANATMQTQVRASVLRGLVLDAIIAQEAGSSGLAATEAEIQNEIAKDVQQAGGPTQLETQLAGAGGSLTQLRDEVRSRLNEAHLEDRFAQQRAAQVEQMLASGSDFAGAARQYSDDSGSSAGGGDLGTITLDALKTYDPVFAAAVRALHAGQYTTTPVHDAGGYDIIQVYAATASARGVRHILVAAPEPYTVTGRPSWFSESLFATVAELCQQGAIRVYIDDAGADPCAGAPTLPASASPAS